MFCSWLPKSILLLRSHIEMSSWLIIVTGLIYVYIAGEQAFKGNIGMAICYAGYAFGNVGLYMMAAK